MVLYARDKKNRCYTDHLANQERKIKPAHCTEEQGTDTSYRKLRLSLKFTYSKNSNLVFCREFVVSLPDTPVNYHKQEQIKQETTMYQFRTVGFCSN